eukprot:271653-Chlamydomonas_euryale.AAC.3
MAPWHQGVGRAARHQPHAARCGFQAAATRRGSDRGRRDDLTPCGLPRRKIAESRAYACVATHLLGFVKEAPHFPGAGQGRDDVHSRSFSFCNDEAGTAGEVAPRRADCCASSCRAAASVALAASGRARLLALLLAALAHTQLSPQPAAQFERCEAPRKPLGRLPIVIEWRPTPRRVAAQRRCIAWGAFS